MCLLQLIKSRTVMLEKTLQSLLDCKEIKPVNPKGNQPWIFIGRNDAEAEGPITWPPESKSGLIGKDPDDGKGWRQKGTPENKMVGWYHQLNGHEFEQALGDSEGQGSLVCYSPCGHKESDTTEWMNNKIQNTDKPNAGKDAEPPELSFTSESARWYGHFRGQFGGVLQN